MKKILVFLFLIIVGSIYLLFFSPVFRVYDISFSGDNPSCTTLEEIEKVSNIKGQNLLFLESPEGPIKEKFLCIRSVVLQKSIPSKAKIELKNRKAVLTLVQAVGNASTESARLTPAAEPVLVDDEGVIFAKDQGQSNQPLVYILDPIGKSIEADVVNGTVKVINKLYNLKANTNEPRIYSKNYLSLGQKPKITFILNETVDRQLASLQLILDQAKMDTKEVEIIDLRFDKPVIRYGKDKNPASQGP
jgi:cell division septal protein FtsQ